MTLSIADLRVARVPVRDTGEPLVPLDGIAGAPPGPGRLVRAGVAARLALAEQLLPSGVRLYLAEGYRPAAAQRAIIDHYGARLRALHPTATAEELHRLTSRYVAPLAVAPHVAGAAVDITLADEAGRPLWMGSALDATPEESRGACFFAAPGIGEAARARRELLATALSAAGLVNYPTEWWHWSYGDRYWACTTGASHARYGPVEAAAAARTTDPAPRGFRGAATGDVHEATVVR
ncbi:M15 family metallopeptidase [Streptomyces bohaiensis]|uniref:M15 family metallopeptidase n=1 Tax=Streptomyces bohaiensis TaxID=1431344 RepID=UPI003B7939B2